MSELKIDVDVIDQAKYLPYNTELEIMESQLSIGKN